MAREPAVLTLNRSQIPASAARPALDARLPMSAVSLRRAAWAGLQDSAPRAALLSIHARVRGTTSSSWEHASLVQLWGPRFSDYVVAAKDLAVFSFPRPPASARGERRGRTTPRRGCTRVSGRTALAAVRAGRAMGAPANSLRPTRPRRAPCCCAGTAPCSRSCGRRRRASDRAVAGASGTGAPLPARVRTGDAGGVCALGRISEDPRRSPPSAGDWRPSRCRCARRCGARVDPGGGRTGIPGHGGLCGAGARLLPRGDSYFLLWEGARDAARARRDTPGPAVDDARLAGRALLVNGRRGRRCVAPVGRAGLH